jgi:hypothetical protein
MPHYEIDDEFFSEQYLPFVAISPEMAEVYFRKMLAKVLANSIPTLWDPNGTADRRAFRSKVASILRRGIRVRECNNVMHA